MALGAGDVTMAGGLPGLDIGTHLVTEAAKGGGFGEFQEGDGKNKEDNDTKDKENFYSFLMLQRSLFGLLEKVDPKGLD